ncbi:MAG TPA: hypothetical protein VFM83_06275 [Gaiellaceae bacterium]|nr:hypothetical protein [Gaiellaceae bacterium]
MTRLLVICCAAAIAIGLAPSVARAVVTVSPSRTEVSTSIGRDFSFTTRVDNKASTATQPLVAHLNVLSLRPGVYVDPEDWSSRRTVFIGSIPARGSHTIDWKVKAVNSGDIGIYVAVLPQSGQAERPVTGPTIHVSITQRRTLNSGGIVPLAAGIPAALAALAVGVRLSRKRR